MVASSLALLYPLVPVLLILIPVVSTISLNDTFTESLHLRPLPLGRVHSTFTFTLYSSLDPFSSSSPQGVSFHLLPPALLTLLHYSPLKVNELRISLNKGRWDHRRWGMPTFLEGQEEWGTEAVANGIETRIRYANRGPSTSAANISYHESHRAREVEQGKDVFHDLLGALSGQLCSTLSAAGSREAITAPLDLSQSLYSQSSLKSSRSNNEDDSLGAQDLFYTLSIPETPCTEVLWRMLTLLPCRTTAGLATLLGPHNWLGQEWHGLELAISRTGEDQRGWRVKIIVGGVWNGVVYNGKRDFSMSSMYGKPLAQACPLAKESFVSLVAPPEEIVAPSPSSSPPYKVEPPLAAEDQNDQGAYSAEVGRAESSDTDNSKDSESEPSSLPDSSHNIASVLMHEGSVRYTTTIGALHSYIGQPYAGRPGGLDVSLSWPAEGLYNYSSSSTPVQDHTLHISRSYTSSSLSHSIFSLRIQNERPDTSRRVVYREVLPWYLLPSLPSATLSITQLPVDESSPFIRFDSDFTFPEKALLDLRYEPSIPRTSAGVLELELRIPPSSEMRWEMKVGREVIRYEEHNPDAHRGLEVGAGSAWEIVDEEEEEGFGREDRRPRTARLTEGGQRSIFKTEVGLVEVAVPDFSMPYNVIIFTSTLLALFAGSAVNLLTRSFKDLAVPPC